MSMNNKYKDINLLLSYYKKPVKMRTKKPSATKFIFPVLLLSVLLFSYLYYYNKNAELENEILQNQDYIESSENIEMSKNSQQLISDISNQNNILNQLNSKISSMQNGISMNKSKINIIYSCLFENSYISEISYDKQTSNVYLDIISNNELDVNQIIKNLKKTGLFADVYYEGYTSSEDNFNFNVYCTLNTDK